ncbi:MAG TPA: putative porin [Candidatus Acidoferrales bacterium]|nr:putative porin [Candidatus Acidoferrales bacterium]
MPTHLGGKWKGIAVGLTLSLALAGSARVAAARSGDNPGGTSAAAPASSTGKADTAKGNAAADPNSPPSVPADLILELKELEEAVAAQTKQFDEHSKELDAERAALHDELARIANLETALGVTPTVAASSTPTTVAALVSGPPSAADQATQTQTPQDWSNRIANIEDQLKNFGPFSFSGDFRLRDEPFFGGPSNESLDQNRERFRLRLNITARLNSDFGAGFSLASGDINDPTSTNQTVTGFYTRKAIAIDKAYVTYTPHEFHALTLIGGKFGYPWYNTELTWDKDLNPEGAAETLAFNLSTPVLKKIAFVGFELPFAQVAKTASPTDQSAATSIVYGGQLQTTFQLAKWLKFGAFTGYYDYHDADSIALALARASAKNPQTPLTGLLPLGTGNAVQNSILTTTATNEVTVGGTSYPTGVTNVTNAQFESKFGLFDSLARFDVTTPSDKWPIAVIGDYVQNTEACANVPFLQAAPANTSSIHYSQSANFSCDANQRRGYWGEVQVGRGQKRGDWQFDYTRIMIEREAVLSNFDYSDIRQGSNVSEHRAMVIYQVHRNVQTSFTALIGRPLNFASTAPAQDWLKRLQFDVIYTF